MRDERPSQVPRHDIPRDGEARPDSARPGDPERCSCAALRQAARHVTRLYDAALAPTGLGLNQYSILARLQRFGAMRVVDLAGKLVMDRSTLGHLLRPLEARGLVEMRVAADDRRSRLVTLTTAGADLTAQARGLWAGAEQHFTRAFGPRDANDLRVVLKRVEAVSFDTVACEGQSVR